MSVPAVPSSTPVIGLEDISLDELQIPRLVIVHREAVYQDSLSNEKFAEFDGIVLGVCKQRVLWEPVLREGGKPMCKSLNGAVGLPADNFPWKESGFDKPTDTGEITLDCAACKLKDWETHPSRPKISWCADQRVLVVIKDGAPYLLSLQRSAMKAVNSFVTNFVKTATPTFTRWVHFGLSAQRTGTVDFAVPVLTVGDQTDEAEHAWYGENYQSIRQVVQSRRVPSDHEEDGVAKAATKTAPAAVSDDEVPW